MLWWFNKIVHMVRQSPTEVSKTISNKTVQKRTLLKRVQLYGECIMSRTGGKNRVSKVKSNVIKGQLRVKVTADNWSTKRATKKDKCPNPYLTHHNKWVKCWVIMLGPIRGLEEYHNQCHRRHLETIWEHT